MVVVVVGGNPALRGVSANLAGEPGPSVWSETVDTVKETTERKESAYNILPYA